MTQSVRVLIGGLVGAIASIWLSGGAVLLAIAGNGLDRMPRPVEVLVAVAFWPSMVLGVQPDDVLRQHLLLNVLINVAGYAVLGGLVGAAIGASRGTAHREA